MKASQKYHILCAGNRSLGITYYAANGYSITKPCKKQPLLAFTEKRAMHIMSKVSHMVRVPAN